MGPISVILYPAPRRPPQPRSGAGSTRGVAGDARGTPSPKGLHASAQRPLAPSPLPATRRRHQHQQEHLLSRQEFSYTPAAI